jgi:hypothetical protein
VLAFILKTLRLLHHTSSASNEVKEVRKIDPKGMKKHVHRSIPYTLAN